MSPINAQCDSKRASPTSSPSSSPHSPPLPHARALDWTLAGTWLLVFIAKLCRRALIACTSHIVDPVDPLDTHTADTDPVRRWPSVLTQHTRQEQQNRVEEHLQQLHLPSLSSSVSVALWIMSIALAQWSSVQLLAHRQPEKRETKQISGAEKSQRRRLKYEF